MALRKMKTRIKQRRAKEKRPPSILVNFKVLPDELDEMIKNCKRETRGNLSEWIREATRFYRPIRGKFAGRR